MLHRLVPIPAPYGGAVKLDLLAASPGRVLVLATDTPDVPDPDDAASGARLVHDGQLRARVQPAFETTPPGGGLWYAVLDLDTDQLPDGRTVHYHVYEDGTHALSAACTPLNLRAWFVVLARQVVKPRLRYHLRRAVAEGVVHVPGGGEVKIHEIEVSNENLQTPCVLMKERAVPALEADTVGKGARTVPDQDGAPILERTYASRVTVDLLVIADNPETRGKLEAFVFGALQSDTDYFQAAGLEGATVQKFTGHDVQKTTHMYSAELNVEAIVRARVTERM